MSFTKDQYIYLLNSLQLQGIRYYESNWNKNDNVKDMRTALKETFNNLNYTGKKDFNTVKQNIETLSNQNIIEVENNEENNEIEEEPPNIESNPLVNQNFISDENMTEEIPQPLSK
jgi:hypothetical protein